MKIAFIYNIHKVYQIKRRGMFTLLAYLNDAPKYGSTSANEQDAVNRIMQKIEGKPSDEQLAELLKAISKK